jgi:hypothetical protein
MKEQLNDLKIHIQTLMDWRGAGSAGADVANRINVAQREMKLLEEASPKPERAIVSPH